MNIPRRTPTPTRTPTELEFDVTQEIDPALADLLQPNLETTLTSADFNDVEFTLLPPKPLSRRGG